MTHLKRTICGWMLLLLIWNPLSASATEGDTAAELRRAVAHLNSWLGADDNARRWRQVLCLNVLDSQAALGYQANPVALANIHRLFQSPVAGLDHVVFRRTRRAIAAHLDQLRKADLDISTALAELQANFQPVTLDQLEAMRDRAVYDIEMMRRFYKVRLTSRPRALLFYELKPDEFTDFLKQIEFELPSARTLREIRDEIEKLEEKKKQLMEEFDELNRQREQIMQWLKDLENKRPQGVDPPGPDNGEEDPVEQDQLDLSDQIESDGTRTAKSPQNGTATALRQEQLQKIDARRNALQQSIDDLDQQIEDLKNESIELRKNEADRGKRFQTTLREFNRLLEPYNAQRINIRDVYFGSAYQSLNRLKSSYLAGADPRTRRGFSDQVEKLIDAEKLLSLTGDRRAAADVGFLTGRLETASQSSDVVAAIRKRYSKANLLLTVSNRLVNQFAARPVNQPERVNEQILGRLIRGSAVVDGLVSVQFQPDPYQVRAAIDFTGGIDSSTYTRSGPFTAYAGAVGHFNVRRELFANVGGMFACDALGDLRLDSYFNCIDSNLRLVQRIARKQYQKSKYRAEAISRVRTLNRLIPQFQEQTDAELDQGFEQFVELNRRQTDWRRVLPELFVHTTADRLVVEGHRSTPSDLAAHTHPDESNSVDTDFSATIHESLLSNYISPLLAGRTFTNLEIAEQFSALANRGDAGQPEPEEKVPEAQEEEFSITFADARPVQIEFEDNTFAVTVSGKRFTRGGDRFPGMRIRFAVRLVRDGDSVLLEPVSDIDVELIDPKKKNLQTVSFISFLQDKLNTAIVGMLENEVEVPENLIPVDLLEGDNARYAERMKLVQLRSENGWLYVGWRYIPENSSIMFAASTPGIWPASMSDDDDGQLDAEREADEFDRDSAELTETISE